MEPQQNEQHLYEIMQALGDLQDASKVKDTEEKLSSAPLDILVPNLILIIELEPQIFEDITPQQLEYIRLQAAVHLKNICRAKSQRRIANFFKETSRAHELLEKVVQILIKSENSMVVGQLSPAILQILLQIRAEGALIVQTINEIYTKATNNQDNFHQKLMTVEAICEIISEYSSNLDVLDQMREVSYLWETDYPSCVKALVQTMESNDSSQEVSYIKNTFITLSMIMLKILKILNEEESLEFIKYIEALKKEVLEIALKSGETLTDEAQEMNLKVVYSLQTLEIGLVNYICLEKKDLQLYFQIADYYINVAFGSENLQIFKKFSDDQLSFDSGCYELVGILAHGIKFHKEILENPMFWVSDTLFSDSPVETTQQLEEALREYYSEEKLEIMCDTLITFYLQIDETELEMWKDDPLSFYFESMNPEKSFMLKELSHEFINSLKLRFPDFLKKYLSKIKQHLQLELACPKEEEIHSNTRKKEALYSFIQKGANFDNKSEMENILSLLNSELHSKSQYSEMLKRRVVLILTSITCQLESKSEQELKTSFLEKVIDLFISETDFCLKLTCISFFYKMFKDYRCAFEAYKGYIPTILNHSCEFIVYVSTQNSGGGNGAFHPETYHEVLKLFALFSQKYPDTTIEYIECNFVKSPSLPLEVKKELIPVIIQILALVEDDKISKEFTTFVASLLHVANTCFSDPIVEDEALKLLLIYLRRLQNYKGSGDNPFVLSLQTFRLAERIVDQFKIKEDDILNVFSVLEEIHFSLSQADTSEITASLVLEVYSNIFRKSFNIAVEKDESSIVLLACQFAATLIISNHNDEIKQVCQEVLHKAKTDIVQRLLGDLTMDLGPPEFKKQPDVHDQDYINGFLILFSAICLEDINVCNIQNINENPLEIQFFKILNSIGPEYLSEIDNLLDSEDGEDTDLKHISACFAVVYLYYCNSVSQQGNRLESLIIPEIQEASIILLKNALKYKSCLLEQTKGVFPSLTPSTNEAAEALLQEVSDTKFLRSRTKRNYVLKTFEKEARLLQELLGDNIEQDDRKEQF
ncbi:unnamed protein product [Moneuplotes crassus]|uniref:Uncharacterized protein n=1 Tax=Euplotes crassus TaxID=5936 RepID=A0AAD2D2Z3_EUPCR|nr:unnamed protein product [Moneuplotes crassus]